MVAAVPASGVLVVPFEVTRDVRPTLVPPPAQVTAVELNLKVDERSVEKVKNTTKSLFFCS